jgi:hypothetical protein
MKVVWRLLEQRADAPQPRSHNKIGDVENGHIDKHCGPMSAARTADMDKMMRDLLWVLRVVAIYLDNSQKHSGERGTYLRYYKTYKYQPGLVFLTKQLTTFVSAFLARGDPDLDVSQITTKSVNVNFTHIHKAPVKWHGHACYARSLDRANINLYPAGRLLPVSTLYTSVSKLRGRAARDLLSSWPSRLRRGHYYTSLSILSATGVSTPFLLLAG